MTNYRDIVRRLSETIGNHRKPSAKKRNVFSPLVALPTANGFPDSPTRAERFVSVGVGESALMAIFASFLVVPVTFSIESANAQDVALRYGTGVPAAVRIINDRGLRYLANSQMEDGGWSGAGSGPGVTGICVMALMASGEDPDFGPYATNIRKALRSIICHSRIQGRDTSVAYSSGHGSMYHHGFALLALSEAYGVVSERLLWEGSDTFLPNNGVRLESRRWNWRCVLR